jgi:molybdenum cofactor cytidylyltransferase
VVVVAGHARSSVEEALTGLELVVAFNPQFASGLASSLRVGLAAMPRDIAGALVLLGDMPEVGAPLIDTLIEACQRKDALAAVPVHEGRRGNPVLLGRGLFEAAMRLEGDEGARRLVAALAPEACVEVPAPDFSAVLDIDTPDDLVAARRFRGRHP